MRAIITEVGEYSIACRTPISEADIYEQLAKSGNALTIECMVNNYTIMEYETIDCMYIRESNVLILYTAQKINKEIKPGIDIIVWKILKK